MEIETKYSIGDIVYCYSHGEVCPYMVMEILIRRFSIHYTKIELTYGVGKMLEYDGQPALGKIEHLPEKSFFSSVKKCYEAELAILQAKADKARED